MVKLLHLPAPELSSNLADRLRQEQAIIQVLNRTRESGLAVRVSSYLAWQGFHVTSTANADRSNYQHSEAIIRDPSKTATIQALKTLLHTQVVNQPKDGISPAMSVI